MTIKLQPFSTPNYVISESRVGTRQEGLIENPKWPLSEVDEDTLSQLCEKFREDVFKKAGKNDPYSLEINNE